MSSADALAKIVQSTSSTIRAIVVLVVTFTFVGTTIFVCVLGWRSQEFTIPGIGLVYKAHVAPEVQVCQERRQALNEMIANYMAIMDKVATARINQGKEFDARLLLLNNILNSPTSRSELYMNSLQGLYKLRDDLMKIDPIATQEREEIRSAYAKFSEACKP